jgi:anti-sigma28 factor (negative regulator of flagellin synthesis)
MRIDDLNRALQTQDTAKTDAVGSERAKTAGTAASNSDADAASISQLASHALDPALDATSVKTHDARLEALRLQVERGEYHVSAQEVAASIIDEHIVK